MPYLFRLFEQKLLRCFFQCISPDSLFDDAYNLFRFVVECPFFFESTFTVSTARNCPIYVEQVQAMEEDTSIQIIRFTKVESQLFDFGCKWNTQSFLSLLHLYQQGNFGYIIGNTSQTVTDDKFFLDYL